MEPVDICEPVPRLRRQVVSSRRPNSERSADLSVRTPSATSTSASISLSWAVLSATRLAFCMSEEKRVKPVKNIIRLELSSRLRSGEMTTGRTEKSPSAKSIRLRPPNAAAIWSCQPPASAHSSRSSLMASLASRSLEA